MGERYKTISKEVQGVLKGEYGAAPAPYNAELQARVLDGGEAITCRPADLLEPEMEKLVAELKELAAEKGASLATGENEIDDVLTYALFPQIGLKFLENRGNPDAFEPAPTLEDALAMAAPKNTGPQTYTINVNGQNYVVQVSEGGDITAAAPAAAPAAAAAAPAAGPAESVPAPLAGNIWKVEVSAGQAIQEGDVLVILEAMKMETEIRAARAGTVSTVDVKEGDTVQVGDSLLTLV
jgi:oxaloacetate decarboxylase alpha subunit